MCASVSSPHAQLLLHATASIASASAAVVCWHREATRRLRWARPQVKEQLAQSLFDHIPVGVGSHARPPCFLLLFSDASTRMLHTEPGSMLRGCAGHHPHQQLCAGGCARNGHGLVGRPLAPECRALRAEHTVQWREASSFRRLPTASDGFRRFLTTSDGF